MAGRGARDPSGRAALDRVGGHQRASWPERFGRGLHRLSRRVAVPVFYRSGTPGLVAFVMWRGAGAEGRNPRSSPGARIGRRRGRVARRRSPPACTAAWLKARAGAAGPALLAVSGVGLLLAAAIPVRENAAGVVYDPGGHIVAGMLFLPATAVAFIVLSHRLARSTLASPGRQHPRRWCPRCRHGAGHHRAGLLRRGGRCTTSAGWCNA